MKRTRTLRKCMTWMALAGMGGTCLQLSTCSQDIRSQILSGLNSATDVLLTSLTGALFQSLENAGSSDDLTDTSFSG